MTKRDHAALAYAEALTRLYRATTAAHAASRGADRRKAAAAKGRLKQVTLKANRAFDVLAGEARLIARDETYRQRKGVA
jgi:hypothetical protein